MAIYIAGMHRSNSSVLSLMLGALRVDLGPRSEDFPAKEDDNPDGWYGEHQPTVKVNELVLQGSAAAGMRFPGAPAGLGPPTGGCVIGTKKQ